MSTVVYLTMIGITEGKPVFEVTIVWGSSGAWCSSVQKYLVYNTEEYPEKKIKWAIK